MSGAYFSRVAQSTPTEFWINNATPAQARQAMELGAVGATTNPTYLAKIAPDDEELLARLDELIDRDVAPEAAIMEVYQGSVLRLASIFRPLFEASGGRHGLVAIQGNPRRNDDAEFMIREGLALAALAENIIVKVPATPAGAAAMQALVRENIPTIATLGFSVAQAVYMAEAYERARAAADKSPRCYVTYIAGILDDVLAAEAREQHLPLDEAALRAAGCEGTRIAYEEYRRRGFTARLMGGGARGPHHFSELAGGDLAITIGWNLTEALQHEAPAPRIDRHAAAETVAALRAHLPDFVKAADPDALSPAEFTRFRPVREFQASFVKAFDDLERFIAGRKTRQHV
ncbi:MAG TPA: transaldolase family protein [Candidatus Sumerlaeota bacterium]|nr:transaldolase family protein [Candidatus Sumerlaeota bacterium]